MGIAAKTLLTVGLAFSGAAMASPLEDLARDAHAMAHDIIRSAQDVSHTRSEREARMTELVRQDHTILLGNHASLLSFWGADSNIVLARHHTVPQRLHSCSLATDAGLDAVTQSQRIESCIGNIRDMAQFGIVSVDEGRLNDLRNRHLKMKP